MPCPASEWSVSAFFQMEDFADVRCAGEGFVQAVFDERLHAEKSSLAADILRRLPVECHLANRRIHCHQFMHCDSAAEACVVAVVCYIGLGAW